MSSEPASSADANGLPRAERGRGDMIARHIVAPLAALSLVLAVGYVLYSPLRVQGDSTEPTLHDADRVLRDKRAGVAARGDIVVVDVGTASTSDDVIKRVIAVAGDTIEVIDDVPYVNGVAERRSNVIIVPSAGVDVSKRTVPDGGIFVMGDNRPVSLDSRFVGPIPVSKVRGKVVFVLLPLSDLGVPK